MLKIICQAMSWLANTERGFGRWSDTDIRVQRGRGSGCGARAVRARRWRLGKGSASYGFALRLAHEGSSFFVSLSTELALGHVRSVR